jgi:hypothetical protein
MTGEEFEKQTLEDLKTDLKDINTYTTFKNGTYIYDLGYYQGRLLVDEIDRLNATINNIHTYIEKMSYCEVVDNPKKELSRILEKGE